MSEVDEIEKLIVAKAEEIRVLKSSQADKAALAPHINELIALKERYKAANGGVGYTSPAAASTAPESKKEKSAPEPVARDGPSKKELNRQKKKEQKEGGKPKEVEAPVEEAQSSASTPVTPPDAPVQTSSQTAKIYFHPLQFPQISTGVMTLAGINLLNLPVIPSPQTEVHQPYLHSPELGSLSGDYSIARYLARQYLPNFTFSTDSWLSAQVDQWIDHCVAVNTLSSPVDLSQSLGLLESHLQDKTFLVGSSFTLADYVMYDLLQRGSFNPESVTSSSVNRWYRLLSAQVPNSAEWKAKAGKAAKAALKSSKPAKKETSNQVTTIETEDTCPELEGAIEGQVVTRFPP